MSFESFRQSFNRTPIAKNGEASSLGNEDLEVLREIEKAGVGAFWATDEAGTVIYLSENAVECNEGGGRNILGKPLVELFKHVGFTGEKTESRNLAFRMQSRSALENLIVEVAPTEGKSDWPAAGLLDTEIGSIMLHRPRVRSRWGSCNRSSSASARRIPGPRSSSN